METNPAREVKHYYTNLDYNEELRFSDRFLQHLMEKSGWKVIRFHRKFVDESSEDKLRSELQRQLDKVRR